MEELTPKQQKVLNFIQQRIQKRLPPTIREIAKALDFSSTGTVRDYLAVLENKGYLKRTNLKSRGIELTNSNFGKIPILGSIAAGKPNVAYEDIQGYIDPNDLFLGRLSYDDVFALKVTGDSMIDAGIIQGDFAIIKKKPDAENGDIIAALLENNEVTLKRLINNTKGIYLEPANKNYEPIRKDFTVIGKLITVIRKY
ncbi:MAG: transcriptional repressor LexA [Candidatus Omnitrophica bacterium]|nr:transcriptional repressor LexA [Candidatus Omnitrophota bacterium]